VTTPSAARTAPSFDRDVITTLASRGLVLVLGVAQSIVVARYLQPFGRGQYATLMLLPQTVVMVMPLGVQWALTYYLKRDESEREVLLRNGTALALLFGAAGFALSWGGGALLRHTFLAGLSAPAILFAAACVPPRIAQACWQGIFRGTARILHANVANALRSGLLLLAAACALVLLRRDVTGLTLAILVAELAVAVAVLPWIFRPGRIGARLDRPVLARLMSYGVRIYVFTVLLFINYRLDVAVLRQLSDFEEVGYYATSVGIAEILWALPTSLSFVLFPSVVALSEERRNVITSSASRITLGLMAVVVLGIYLLARPGIRLLYGEVYLPAVPSLFALLPGVVAMSLQQVLGADVSGRGKPGIVTVAAATGIPVNLALNLWWIPRWGAVGAAWASTVSYSVVTGLVLVAFLRASGLGVAEVLVPGRRDAVEVYSRLSRLLGARRGIR